MCVAGERLKTEWREEKRGRNRERERVSAGESGNRKRE